VESQGIEITSVREKNEKIGQQSSTQCSICSIAPKSKKGKNEGGVEGLTPSLVFLRRWSVGTGVFSTGCAGRDIGEKAQHRVAYLISLSKFKTVTKFKTYQEKFLVIEYNTSFH